MKKPGFLMLARRVGALALLALATAGTVGAQGGKTARNVDESSVILGGFDAVAYQAESKAVPGSAAFTATHDGAIYRFASAANRDTFMSNPTRYSPAYGGYCAMGVAVGKKLNGDPRAFTVHEGKLYLNVDEKVRGMWSKDIAGNEKKAAKNWAAVAAHGGFDKM